MGYATDERVKEYVGWQDERISRASEQYFAQEGHSSGGVILMAKHDKMNEINQHESQRKMELENLKRENEELKKQNQKLEKALEKTRLEYLKLL